MAPRAPEPSITAPLSGAWFAAGESIALRGRAFDAEESLVPDDHLAWSVPPLSATGRTAEAVGLAPGAHTVTLRATDSTGLQGTAAITFTIAPLTVPTGAVAALDGVCDDAAYASASAVPLAPYPGGSRATAFFARTSADLVVCIQGLEGSGGQAGLYIDGDNSRDATVQTGDLAFLVQPDGTPRALAGSGGAFTSIRLSGWSARISQNGPLWNAEFRLSAGLLGGLNHRVGLAVGHVGASGGAQYAWPIAANPGSPQTWAQANLGQPPTLGAMTPISTTVGSGPLTLSVSGAGFDEETVVLWNGAPISTTFVDTTALSAQVPGANLSAAGSVDIQVAPATALALASLPARFTVFNPAPAITALSPSSAPAESPGFTLTVRGSRFVPGAIVQWNGEARPTAFVDSTRLRATISAADVAAARTVRVTAVNPEPSLGGSNQAAFEIERTVEILYLPVIFRR
ncbi:MAG: hypothetical protein M5U01_14380 [Ardenticatenaceae bacterium]|nr:hypothetical protein [Ardenticatenaceae bacterium]